jgi:phosphogluconate dehydratase
MIHPVVEAVTARIVERSADLRGDYLAQMHAARSQQPARANLPCSNLAHVFAASGTDKPALRSVVPNLGIVTAYNDMLSAHQPLERYPEILRAAARLAGGTAQVAGGVPAMCDGITQGRDGMELSLFSRDVIALATTIALSHEAFDATVLLGVCDKIVPGLFIGAAAFGHLPTLFVPAGPMPSGIPNRAKAEVRQRYAEGQANRDELLAAESASYHDAGTCTFYGTANSNQMLMEVMGLHVPGAAFVNPGTPLRHALTVAAAQRALQSTALDAAHYLPFAQVIDARSIVNAVVGLMATGGSTNHTIHLVAMARAVGVRLNWEDMAELSAATPLLARIYPNGAADVNQFHAAGGMAFVVRELLAAGLLHADVNTVWGPGLAAYATEPWLQDNRLAWRAPPTQSLDDSILRPASRPFSSDGGLKLLRGNLGEAVIKTSAVDPQYWHIEAPARVFESQEALAAALKQGAIEGDFVAVVRGQGPRANGMPELHKLMPALGALLSRGRRVALVTDGRLSGASGKVPAAIHLTPEAVALGPISRLRDGDPIVLDARSDRLEVLVDAATFAARTPVHPDPDVTPAGLGRELFSRLRRGAGSADQGASILW